jgi:hypothetical protein
VIPTIAKFVKGGIDRGGCVGPEQRITIGWRTDDGLRRDILDRQIAAEEVIAGESGRIPT